MSPLREQTFTRENEEIDPVPEKTVGTMNIYI